MSQLGRDIQNHDSIIINPVCKTYEDVVKSEDFRKGVEIVLKHHAKFAKKDSQKYDANIILGALEKMGKGVELSDKEKNYLMEFFNDDEIKQKANLLLVNKSKLLLKFNGDVETFCDIMEIFTTLFSVNGYARIKRTLKKLLSIDEKYMTQKDKELMTTWGIKYPEWYWKCRDKIIFGENYIGFYMGHGRVLKVDRENLSAKPKKNNINYKGNCYFSRQATIDELKLQGKKPFTEENLELIRSLVPVESGINGVQELLNIPLVGSFDADYLDFVNFDIYGHLWLFPKWSGEGDLGDSAKAVSFGPKNFSYIDSHKKETAFIARGVIIENEDFAV